MQQFNCWISKEFRVKGENRHEKLTELTPDIVVKESWLGPCRIASSLRKRVDARPMKDNPKNFSYLYHEFWNSNFNLKFLDIMLHWESEFTYPIPATSMCYDNDAAADDNILAILLFVKKNGVAMLLHTFIYLQKLLPYGGSHMLLHIRHVPLDVFYNIVSGNIQFGWHNALSFV